MREKMQFLFALFTLMLLISSSNMCLALDGVVRSGSGGGMKSAVPGGGDATAAALLARRGGVRDFKWANDSASGKIPGDRSARGAVDGLDYSSKDNTFTTTVLADTVKVGQQENGTIGIYKAFLSFNTSGIPQDAANLSLIIYMKRKVISGGGRDFKIHVFKSNYEEPLWNSDWGAVKENEMETTESRKLVSTLAYPPDPNASLIDPDTCRYVITIKDPVSLLDPSGTTKLALESSSTFEGLMPLGDEFVEIYSPNAPKELRPALTFSYEAGSLPTPRPTLTWLSGDAQFKDTGVQPDKLYEGHNMVTFRARYFYTDITGGKGLAPSVHQVLIDLNNDGDFTDANEQVTMTEVNPADDDYTDGKDYEAKDVDIVSIGSDIKHQFLFKTNTGTVTEPNLVEAGGTPSRAGWISAIQTDKSSSSDSSKTCFISSIRRLW